MLRRTAPQLLVGTGAVLLLAASVVGYLQRDAQESGSGGGRNMVTIASFSYDPDPIETIVGATVTWSNADDFAHTVTSTGAGLLDSGEIGADGTYQATFDAPGTYEYLCTIHPSMRGVVQVSNA